MSPPAGEAAARMASPPSTSASIDLVAQVSAVVASGTGLPEVARATGRALDASVVILDDKGAVVAAACASPADEQAVRSGTGASDVVTLEVAGQSVGQLRLRGRGAPLAGEVLQIVARLIALEVDRSRAPERASEAAVSSFVRDLLTRRLTDRADIVARARGVGADLDAGGTVIVVRAHPHLPEEGDWRGRVLEIAERGARAVAQDALAAAVDYGPGRRPARGEGDRVVTAGELVILLPGAEPALARRVVDAVLVELQAALPGYGVVVAHGRAAGDPASLHRAGAEALLAANVAEARGEQRLAFEETGSYRLLLPAMTEDPEELERFQSETVAPIVAYDEQYESDLVRTLETFLDADGNVAQSAQRLFTHRHTVRYRLERIRELTGLDVGSTEGRERLSLGLKAMRVLGIASPGGPATEPGAAAGRVPREGKDR